MRSPNAYASMVLLFLAGGLFACHNAPTYSTALDGPDSSSIEAVQSAYVKAWLADDTAGVLATLDSSAILLPPGRLPISGHRDIRAFWWPTDGSHTTLTAFEWDAHELVGDGRLAFSRGLSTITWRYAKDTVRSVQTTRSPSLTILRQGDDGRWRILRQMWGPALPN